MADADKSQVRFGPFSADLNTGELRKNGVRIKLGGQPFAILAALLERPGDLVTREELRKRIWAEDTYVDFSHGLNAGVNKLREALSDSAQEPRYIETLPRRGYRFISQIEPTDVQPEPATLSAPISPPPPSQAPPPPALLPPDSWLPDIRINRKSLAGISTAAVLLVFLATLGVRILFRRIERSDLEPREAAAKVAKRTAEQASFSSPGIWQLAVAHLAEPKARIKVISGPEAVEGPQPSPDGRKLVFMAGRLEAMDIWVSNLDGSAPTKLTNIAKCGAPRWSPDSRWIAFDSDGRSGDAGIYVVSADGGPIRPLVTDVSNNMVPSWSRDGKWIYFASNRDTTREIEDIWKVPVEAGQPIRVTRNGGFAAYESPDGRALYYAKSRYDNPEIWQVPIAGGPETRVSSLLHPTTWANWAVTKDGILFLTDFHDNGATLDFFDFATHGVRELGVLPNASFWLSASSNGEFVWYPELASESHPIFRAGME